MIRQSIQQEEEIKGGVDDEEEEQVPVVRQLRRTDSMNSLHGPQKKAQVIMKTINRYAREIQEQPFDRSQASL